MNSGKIVIVLAVLTSRTLGVPVNFYNDHNGRRSLRSVVGECPEKDGAFPVYLPDSESCGIYYECSNGLPIQNSCADGLEWNTKLNTCDRPSSSNCKAPDHITKMSLPRSVIGECPAKDGAYPVYLPDSESCGVYYECSNGIPIMNVCAGDLEWSPSKNTCVLPVNSDCTSGKKEPF